MAATNNENVIEETPQETWSGLENASDAVLVDVRTKAEWSFVGIPDLSALGKKVILQEWRQYPDMSVNEGFVANILDQFGGSAPSKIYFLCRSGVRSLEAAHVVNKALSAQGQSAVCVNVLEGFEGDLNPERHRGETNGWKSRGLAWGQS
ncbi:rhodanese-like domain-containing protein [Amylibacter sp. SFDW26]|uniref:rhodanese-like domain-containing protein n=1 Tax=Amylibacter sp. SFDW26 TaxID=2652722 RepID=UPI001262755F|nr:rhodanese-like domain-containing protein [Amylibacter sp. SFDW26]KAB7614414.1 rhodanese-like domain-containing protein [Amylibacter sp. SFDW26]